MFAQVALLILFTITAIAVPISLLDSAIRGARFWRLLSRTGS